MPLLPLFIQPFMILHLPPPDSFKSHAVIITGSNTGIGMSGNGTAHCLPGGLKNHLGVRTISKGLLAKTDIETSTGRTGVVEVWELHLESFASVKAFATRAERLDRVDTAIMNAGMASLQWNLSPEGWGRQIQVNVLSTTLLSLLLLPQLVRTKKTFVNTRPHLVLLGRDVHLDTKFKERNAIKILEELNKEDVWKKTADSPERYSECQQITRPIQYIAIELARLTPVVGGESAVIVDVVAPGFCKSELLTREPGDLWALKALQALTGRTLQEGSKTVVDAVTRGSEAHGQYLNHQKITRPGTLVTLEEGVRVRKKVWDEIVEILVYHAPEISLVTSGRF